MPTRHLIHRRPTLHGFTLVELLVVVTIIVILLSLLTPALDRALVQAELALCGARHKGLNTIFATYAVENKQKYPSGWRDDGGGYEHMIWVSTKLVQTVTKSAGHRSRKPYVEGQGGWGVVPEMLIDPSFEDFGYYLPPYGWVVGYNYLGGHPGVSKANDGTKGTPKWTSPQGLGIKGSGQLTACHNSWANNSTFGLLGSSFTVVAHTQEGGPYGSFKDTDGYFNYNEFKSAYDVGTAGGNVGYVDGSVRWRSIQEIDEQLDGRYYWTGCDSNGNGGAYPAIW